MKNDQQLEFAENCLHIFYEKYPERVPMPSNLHGHRFGDASLVLDLLEHQGWIDRDYLSYKLTTEFYSIYKKYGSYAKYYKSIEQSDQKEQRKNFYEFEISKWKYRTFWPLFIFAIFGGMYSIYDLSTKLIGKKEAVQNIVTKEQMELELSKLHILILDQKMNDSLYKTSIQYPSLKNKK